MRGKNAIQNVWRKESLLDKEIGNVHAYTTWTNG